MSSPTVNNETMALEVNTVAFFKLPGQRVCGRTTLHHHNKSPPAIVGGGGFLSATTGSSSSWPLSSSSPAAVVVAAAGPAGPSKKRSRQQRSSTPGKAPSPPLPQSFAWRNDENNKENIDPRTGRTTPSFSPSFAPSSFPAGRGGRSFSPAAVASATAFPLSCSRKKRMLQRDGIASSVPRAGGCGKGGGGGGGPPGGLCGASSLREPLRVLWTREGSNGAPAPFCLDALRAMR